MSWGTVIGGSPNCLCHILSLPIDRLDVSTRNSRASDMCHQHPLERRYFPRGKCSLWHAIEVFLIILILYSAITFSSSQWGQVPKIKAFPVPDYFLSPVQEHVLRKCTQHYYYIEACLKWLNRKGTEFPSRKEKLCNFNALGWKMFKLITKAIKKAKNKIHLSASDTAIFS